MRFAAFPSPVVVRAGRLGALALVIVLAGCAGPTKMQVPPGTGSPTARAEPSAPGVAALSGEQRWLQQLFDGTPVVVAGEADGSVVLEVPIAYAFDDQKSAPKPPMRAVLDRISTSLFRQPRAQLHLGPPGPAARERLAALRQHLTTKGVAAPRLLAAAPRQSDMVLLRLSPPPAGLSELDDRQLPPAVLNTPAPRAAAVPVKPPATAR